MGMEVRCDWIATSEGVKVGFAMGTQMVGMGTHGKGSQERGLVGHEIIPGASRRDMIIWDDINHMAWGHRAWTYWVVSYDIE